MTTFNDPQSIVGRTAVDQDGDKIGKVGQVYLDDQSGQPAWVTISTGLFGNHESFAPVYGARDNGGGDLVLGVTKEQVKGAPHIADDGHLSEDEQSALYDYYGSYLGRSDSSVDTSADYDTTTTNRTETAGYDSNRETVGHDTSGPTTDDAMTRSEERLSVGVQRVESGRARLRKYIVTENVSQTVPVSHEEIRIEREPITDANRGAALSGPERGLASSVVGSKIFG